jgi:NAD(P)-dependent dehydrogenase (short-subunit alcohol dehydrogenase family)
VYTKRNRIDGKVVIITGCNTGLGKAAAIELAKRGAKLYMACRDMKKCDEARKEVVELSKNTAVFARELDLGSLASVRRFAKQFLEEENRLDILMNNAGVSMMSKSQTVDGFESHMGINHLGHFLLTNLLLDLLKVITIFLSVVGWSLLHVCPQKSAPSRVVVLSSIAHNFGVIHKDDLMLEKQGYGRYAAYCNSKLANMLFTLHLNRLVTGTRVTVNSVNPGETETEIGRHLNAWIL